MRKFGVLLLLVCSTCFATDHCEGLVRLTVLRSDKQVFHPRDTHKPLILQELRLEQMGPSGTRTKEGLAFGAYSFTIEGPHQSALIVQSAHADPTQVALPHAMQQRLFQLLSMPLPPLGDNSETVRYLADAEGFSAQPVGKEVELPIGQIVGVGPVNGPALMAVYIGNGLYLTTYAQPGKTDGIVAVDMKALQRYARSENISLLKPLPHGTVLHLPSDTGLAPAPAPAPLSIQNFPLMSWDWYDSYWNYYYALRANVKVNDRDRRVADILYHQHQTKHPDVKIKERLGIHFGQGEAYGDDPSDRFILPFTVPSLRDYVKNYDAILNEAIAAGRLTENDVFRIARVFRNWKGDELFLRYGHNPPEGFHEVDPTRVSNQVISRMLEQGFTPLSVVRAFHDSHHTESFAAHPVEYMKPLRALARQMGAANCTLSRADKTVRVLVALESLGLVPKRNRAKLLPLLARPLQDSSAKLVTVAEVKDYFRRQDFATEVLPHAQALLEKSSALVNNFGGGARDLSLEWRISGSPFRENLAGMAARLQLLIDHSIGKNLEFLDPAEEAQIVSYGSRQAVICHQLAHLEVALKESTRISVSEFLKALAENQTDPNSNIYRMLVLSGISDDIDHDGSQGLLAQSIQRNATRKQESSPIHNRRKG